MENKRIIIDANIDILYELAKILSAKEQVQTTF